MKSSSLCSAFHSSSSEGWRHARSFLTRLNSSFLALLNSSFLALLSATPAPSSHWPQLSQSDLPLPLTWKVLKSRTARKVGDRPAMFSGWDKHFGFQLYQSDPSGNYGGWKATAIGNTKNRRMFYRNCSRHAYIQAIIVGDCRCE